MAQQVTKSIIVNGSPSDIYNLWSDFENFPNFMQNIKSVTKTGERRSHWVMEGPMGKDLEWDAETTSMDRNKRIAWKSTSGDIDNQGQVTFREMSNDRTEITVMISYSAPGGKATEAISKMFKDPERRLEEDLENFKEYAESVHQGVTTR